MTWNMKKKNRKKSEDLSTRLITRERPKSLISEQYRTIRTNIEFSAVDKDLKTIICTSANPYEGKSTTITNLATTFAQQGKKVLFVDADLRKPTAHRRFQLDNKIGLTSVLTKRHSLERAISLTNVENLWLLPSGPIPPNPAELLGSKSLIDLIEKSKTVFDMVIFDSPPVLAVTDAQILGNLCDGALLVVRSNSTEKEVLQKAKSLLDKANVDILGAILNGVDQDKMKYYYYYGK